MILTTTMQLFETWTKEASYCYKSRIGTVIYLFYIYSKILLSMY